MYRRCKQCYEYVSAESYLESRGTLLLRGYKGGNIGQLMPLCPRCALKLPDVTKRKVKKRWHRKKWT